MTRLHPPDARDAAPPGSSGAVPARALPPAPPTPAERLCCAALAFGLDVLMGWRHLPAVLAGGYVNPDTTMRLGRLAATLHAGVPVDLVTRDQSGVPFALHWSHLVDMLLLALAAPLRLFLPGGPQALDAPLPAAVHWAAVLWGPLSVAALALALLWAIAPFADRSWRWFAGPALALCVPVANYGLAGEVHHHVLLAVVGTMLAGWALRAVAQGTRAGWRLGLWAGVGIWLSPETMPLIVMAVGGVGLLWLVRPDVPNPRRALLAIGPGFLLVLLLALAVDPGSGDDWRHAIDRISMVYVQLAAAVCVIGAGAWALDRTQTRPALRGAGGVAVAVLALGAWLAANPVLLRGTDALIALPRALALQNDIAEMRPVASFADALRELTQGVFAAVVLATLAWRRRSLVLGYAALCALALLGATALHRRFCTYDGVLAVGLLVVLLGVSARARWGSGLAGTAARVGGMALVLALPVLPDLHGTAAARAPAAPDCSLRHIATLLGPYAGEIVLSDANDAPELRYRTGVLTVGSLYHRAPLGLVRLADAWRSPGGTASPPPEIRATRATLVLACPGQGRTSLVRDLPPETLFDRLNRNQPPPWLERIGGDAAGHVLYRVRPAG